MFILKMPLMNIVGFVLKRNIIYLNQQKNCVIQYIFEKRKNLVLGLKTAVTSNF